MAHSGNNTPEPASSSRLSDPDYLAVFARVTENSEAYARQIHARPFLESRTAKRQGAVLDSLAFISVSQAQNQAVAVGAQLLQGPDRCMIILVADNRPVFPGLIEHLQDIFDRLQRIHAERPEREFGPIKPYISYSTSSPFERELLALEVAILKYSWDKLKHRFTKNSRHLNFIQTADDVCGLPAQERTDRDQRERELLERLQGSADLQKDEIKMMAERTADLADALAHPADDQEALVVRALLHRLLLCEKDLRGKEIIYTWNLYTRQRLINTGNTPLPKDPDILRWLSKVSTIREHYLKIANIATSRTLSALLLQGVQVQAAENPAPHPMANPISLDRQALEQVLAAANCEIDKSEEKYVDEFLGTLAKTHKIELSDGKFVLDTSMPVHCECQLLAQMRQQPAIPYIGVTKPSCIFCDMYFAAYRDATKSTICTRGARSQTVDWACPQLADEPTLDSDIRQRVCQKLLSKIKRDWDLHRRPPQSTDASRDHMSWTTYGGMHAQLSADEAELLPRT
ncbi:hypothetical protein B0H11DRAFT_188973 [Mycena galericulata]|nr:hypothetical protein B0H11DRAFT_188973 [Mycena galericulata]